MITSSVVEALKSKIPGYRDLADIPMRDNGETMVRLVTRDNLYVRQIGDEMFPYTGNDIWVRENVAERLQQAADYTSQTLPNVMLQVHYGFRHPEIQEKRFAAFMQSIANRDDITDKEQYAHIFIAEPSVAGHPTGGAVDVALVDRETKNLLDMGTGLSDFRDETLTFYPFISREAWSNRNVLRNMMVRAGFAPYDGEWWHFSYGDREWACYCHQPQACYAPTIV